MQLVTPCQEHLDAYCAALKTGWSPDNTRPEAAADELRAISEDAAAFVASLDDPEARGADIQLADGTFVKRLPGFRRWIWDDGFCGSISLRWQPGTNALPPTCLGHIGYGVVPWRRREGLASGALRAILPLARDQNLTHVDITVDPDNAASIGVIAKVGGYLVARYDKHPSLGTGEELLYRIDLPATGLEPHR